MFIDVIAMIMGILWSIRKMEIRRTYRPPELSEERFDAWQLRALGAYNLGIFACFGKIILDYGFQFFAARLAVPWSVVRVVGGSLFVLWLVLLLYSVFLSRRVRIEAAELGIDSRGGAPDSPPA